ncbi:Uncharacterised protein [Serratia ficaria]|uniref:Uncharacterized protein n=1 Tax=Serratia ficaria TaxID=61651 RepID=A0A240C744_SERFI|nr:hypothetical protein C7332_2246 [Serratia ficaria]CAI0726392.1 Uncharacterised protein [Serratia ficaria]CAI0744699.1 Uncharacterised protein [Serratia ficaria]CAI0755387.1 Uncharacterised protein [Serratia ficaria]CAI1159400.1 Uncharacterised protein [Serratia ficaria]
MKLSFCTDSLGHLPFEAMLDHLCSRWRTSVAALQQSLSR